MGMSLDTPSTLPRFSDEIILEVLHHCSDAELLELSTISRHIHELALLSLLSRYGITESDIASNSFPPLSTSGAFRAFPLARFITGVDELRLQFDYNCQLEKDVRALTNLVRRLPPIKKIDLEFPPRFVRAQTAAVRRCDMEGAMLALISAYRSRPSVAVSPLTLSIIRPRKPAFYAVRRLYSGIRAMGSKNYVRKGPLIDDQEFRKEMFLFALLRVGGVIPNISIRAFDPPNPLGTLIVLRAAGIANLRFPSNLKLSCAEMSAVFDNLKLPLLRSVEAALSTISPPSLLAFLCRHPSLQRLQLRGPPDHPKAKSKTCTEREPLAPGALPQLEHVLGSAHFVAWVLASAHPFPQFTAVTIELHKGVFIREDYQNALCGIALRPVLCTLTLHLEGWDPWSAKDFDAATAPERDLSQIADLRLTFKFPSRVGRNLALLVEWLRLFRGLREVSLFDTMPLGNLSGLLGKECPNITFTSYKLEKQGGA
ncbi:hypothetical protein C8R44DRAFT_883771 [Mycena epipterygia]|nr:hypothetical protein C8R44DRAFT_883771 [Mycena epipterygia]